MTSRYFLGFRLLGEAPQSWWSSTELASASLAFTCPVCGDTWGRVEVEGMEWVPLRRGCPLHPWPDLGPGGSFIPPWSFPIESLPLPVLRREFMIHLNHHLALP